MTNGKLRAEWFWLDRWFSSSACCLPIDARGLYRELLSRAWSMGAKLPKDHGILQRLAGVTPEEWIRLWPQISRYWEEKDGHLVNETQLEIYADAMTRKRVKVDRAKKGAEARWAKAREEKKQCSSNAQATAKQCPPSPSPSMSKEPTPKKLPAASPPPDDPAFAGIVSLLAGHEKWKNGIRKREEFAASLLVTYGPGWGGHGILLELRKMAAWLAANPKKRYKEHRRFIVNWFNRQDPPAVPERDNGPAEWKNPCPPGHPCYGLSPGKYAEKDGALYGIRPDLVCVKKVPDGIWLEIK